MKEPHQCPFPIFDEAKVATMMVSLMQNSREKRAIDLVLIDRRGKNFHDEKWGVKGMHIIVYFWVVKVLCLHALYDCYALTFLLWNFSFYSLDTCLAMAPLPI